MHFQVNQLVLFDVAVSQGIVDIVETTVLDLTCCHFHLANVKDPRGVFGGGLVLTSVDG